jgi:molybdopterin-guanine dinucleotide biosynthesis protein A
MTESADDPLEATGYVLAGGESRRFGEDKALFTVDGEPLIQRPIACLEALCGSVAIVAKHPATYAPFGVSVVQDGYEQQMPHVGVLTALEAAETEWSVVLACDMPSITPDVVQTLYEAREGADGAESVQAVVPETPSGVHPLAAWYHQSAAAVLRTAIEEEWSLRGWLSEIATRVVSFEDEEPFRNVNRKEDLPASGRRADAQS